MSLPFPEYDDLDATGLAALIRAGEVTAEEALDAALARVDARNPALNAVVIDLRERARGEVGRLPEGPLHGVPMLLKDLKAMLKGTITTGGTRLFRERVAEQSTVLVERLEGAGVQLVGKSSSPEFGLLGISEPELWGPCRNPWDTDRTSGGSSGGSASAVAARIVPVAHGGDGGGSIRIPASCCGLFGLKPTRGRVSMAPNMGDAWMGLVQEHALTRSVRDSALMLDLVDPPVVGEPYAAPPKARPWVEEVGAPPGKLRIAVHRGPLFTREQDPVCTAAVDDAVALLRDLGHEVVEACPDFDREALVRAYYTIVAGGVGWMVDKAAAWAGVRPRMRDFEPPTWFMSLLGHTLSAADMEAARQHVQQAGRSVGAFFEDYDLMLSSTLAFPPAPVGAMASTAAERLQIRALTAAPLRPLLELGLDRLGEGRLRWTPNTQLFNVTGLPAASLPLYWTPEGLPIGVQLAAGFGDEATLFRIAAQLEEARPWADKKPPLVTA